MQVECELKQRTLFTTIVIPQHLLSVSKVYKYKHMFPPANIPGWVVTVIKQAVLLSGCHPLHFGWRLGSAGSIMGSAHSRIFGSGGEMRLRVDPPFIYPFVTNVVSAQVMCDCVCV
jgi:hypothetical protein